MIICSTKDPRLKDNKLFNNVAIYIFMRFSHLYSGVNINSGKSLTILFLKENIHPTTLVLPRANEHTM